MNLPMRSKIRQNTKKMNTPKSHMKRRRSMRNLTWKNQIQVILKILMIQTLMRIKITKKKLKKNNM